jgi:hypothetical protein
VPTEDAGPNAGQDESLGGASDAAVPTLFKETIWAGINFFKKILSSVH